MINQQAIANITATFLPEYAAFVQGDFAATAAAQIASQHQFTNEQKDALQDGFTLYLLAAFSSEDLLDHIITECALPEEEARLLLYGFQLMLPPNFSQLQAATKLALENLPTETLTNTTPTSVAPAPTVTGVTSTASPHIRTMAADMTKSQNSGERIYTSTQEAILREGWSTPKQTPPQPPTTGSWG